jgi:hypothetical protein
MGNPKDTYTLEDFIEAGDSVIYTYNNFSFIETFGDIKFPVFNVLSDYITELQSVAKTVVLNDMEYNKYLYKPKILAYDVYQNPELHFVIMAINGICNVKDFDFKTLKLLEKTHMKEALGYIYNAERNDIEIYNNRTEED